MAKAKTETTLTRPAAVEGAIQVKRGLGAEKLTSAEQRRRFIEAAREAGASEDEADFDAALGRIVKAKAVD